MAAKLSLITLAAAMTFAGTAQAQSGSGTTATPKTSTKASSTTTSSTKTATAQKSATATGTGTASKAAAGILPKGVPVVHGVVKTAYSLKYEDYKIGTGALAPATGFFTVQYTGYLASDGKKFDSSLDRKEPATFPVGAHRVIPGWETGFAGMRIGGKRRLFIPYQLAYGEAGRPPVIPAKADLIFDVELISVSDKPPAQKEGAGAPPQGDRGMRRPGTPPPTTAAPQASGAGTGSGAAAGSGAGSGSGAASGSGTGAGTGSGQPATPPPATTTTPAPSK